jgi:hypothetical protein
LRSTGQLILQPTGEWDLEFPTTAIFQPAPADPAPVVSWLGTKALGGVEVADVLNGAVGIGSVAAAVVSTRQRETEESTYLTYLSRV